MKKVFKTTTTILACVIIVALCFMLFFNLYTIVAKKTNNDNLPTLFGVGVAVVMSGSMSGEIEVNDLVVVQESDSYKKGDVITFDSGNSIVTHRIVEVTDEGFVTKGDANNTEDSGTVSLDKVQGKVVAVIPKLGAVINFMRSTLGMLTIVGAVIIIILAPQVVRAARKPQRKQKEVNRNAIQ